jgi:hypothetical protein
LAVEKTGIRCVLAIVIRLGSQQNPRQRQDLEAIASWVRNLTGRCGEGRIAIGVGRRSGPLIHALMQYENLVTYLINPKQLARYRESPFPSGGKDDPGDAWLLAHFLQVHHRQFRP